MPGRRPSGRRLAPVAAIPSLGVRGFECTQLQTNGALLGAVVDCHAEFPIALHDPGMRVAECVVSPSGNQYRMRLETRQQRHRRRTATAMMRRGQPMNRRPQRAIEHGSLGVGIDISGQQQALAVGFDQQDAGLLVAFDR